MSASAVLVICMFTGALALSGMAAGFAAYVRIPSGKPVARHLCAVGVAGFAFWAFIWLAIFGTKNIDDFQTVSAWAGVLTLAVWGLTFHALGFIEEKLSALTRHQSPPSAPGESAKV